MPPVSIPLPVEYKPVSVRVLLRDMKNVSSLMLDLAFYSLMYCDKKLAREVLRLEEYMDYMWSLLVMQASLAVRDAEDAESMVSIFKIASSTDKLSDAAADIAMLALLGVEPHPSVTLALTRGEEVVTRIKVRRGSKLGGLSLEEAFRKLNTALDVMAIRRGSTWVLNPPDSYVVREDDVLIVRGPRDSVELVRAAARDVKPKEEVVVISREVEEEIASGVKEIKDLSEIMVDLAYLSIITNDRTVALEVLQLEEYLDSVHTELEMKIIERLKDASPEGVLALLRLLISLENIGDSAAEIASVVASELKPHPILSRVVAESEEKVIIAPIGDELDGVRIRDLQLDDHGAMVLAVKRGNSWNIIPSLDFVLRSGDQLIVKCYSESVDQVREILRI